MKRLMLCAMALVFAVPGVAVFAEEPIATELDTSAAQEYIGSWSLSMDFQGNPVEMTLNVVDLDGKIGATVDGARMPEPTAVTEASITADGIVLTYPIDFGGNAFTLDLTGKVEDGEISGTVAEQSGLFSADFVGTKTAAAEAAPAGPVATATELDTAEAEEYLGYWDVTMDFQGNAVEMGLHIVDVDGKIGAVIDNEQMPEPAMIKEASVDESGLTLTYDANFGGQVFTLDINGQLADDKFEGTFREQSGLFEANFTAEEGEPPVATASEEGEEGERRRRRGGGQTARLSIDGANITISFADIKTEGEDYDRFTNLEDGDVFKFVGGRATKLRTDWSLKFDEAVVKNENAAPDYPGVYSLWLRKVSADEWNLVFNEDADIWGTQHVPERDAVEIPLTVGTPDEPAETFRVELEENDNGGTLTIAYGEMEWAADFTVTGEPVE